MPYAFVASHQHNTGSSGTTTVTFTLLAGQSMIVFSGDGNNQGSGMTITDSLSNTYTSRKSQNDTFNGESYNLADCLAPATTGSVTVTATSSAGNTSNTGIIVLVYTGLASFDNATSKFAHSAWSTATNGAQSTGITPASQPGLLLGIGTGQGGTITADSGANSRLSNTTWFNAQNTNIEDYRFTVTTSQVASFTFSSATASNVIFAGTYLEPAPAAANAYFLPTEVEM